MVDLLTIKHSLIPHVLEICFFDQDLSFDSHIKQVSKIAFFHYCIFAKIKNILSQRDAEKLLHAFVTLRLDSCNSLLLGCPKYSLKSLQLIQKAAATVLMRTRTPCSHKRALRQSIADWKNSDLSCIWKMLWKFLKFLNLLFNNNKNCAYCEG